MTAIKIQTQQTYIPFQLGDLELRFDLKDDSVMKLRKSMVEINEEFKKIDEVKDEEKANQDLKITLGRIYDEMFGEGTFDKVYAMTPSTLLVLEYFKLISEALFDEMEKRGLTATPQDKAKKYLANKNKKK